MGLSLRLHTNRKSATDTMIRLRSLTSIFETHATGNNVLSWRAARGELRRPRNERNYSRTRTQMSGIKQPHTVW